MIPALKITNPATGHVQVVTYPSADVRGLEMILLRDQPVILEPFDVPEVEQFIEETQRQR